MKLLLVFLEIVLIQPQIVQIQFYKFDKNTIPNINQFLYLSIVINSLFGIPFYPIKLCLNWDSPYTWIKEKRYNTLISEYFGYRANEKGESLIYDDALQTGFSVYDVLSFKNLKKKDQDNVEIMKILYFYLAKNFLDMETNCDGVMGMKFDHVNKSYKTVIDQLKENKVISTSQYSIEYNSSNQGYITLNETNNEDYIFECNIVDDYALSQWYSRINSIVINGDNIMDSPFTLVKISSSFGMIMISSKMKDKVINKLIPDKELCTENKIDINANSIEQHYLYLICDNSIIQKTKKNNKIEIHFQTEKDDRNIISFDNSDLFLKFNTTHVLFSIVFDISEMLKFHDMIIGEVILKKYKVNYNKDNYLIRFYPIEGSSKSSFVLKFFITLLSFMILFAFAYYLRKKFFIVKGRKKQLKNTDIDLVQSPLV